VGEENRLYLVLAGRPKMHNANYKPESAPQGHPPSFSQDSQEPADSPALYKPQSSEILGASVSMTKGMLVDAEKHYIKYRYRYFQWDGESSYHLEAVLWFNRPIQGIQPMPFVDSENTVSGYLHTKE
jgi:hypothetical protein